MAKRRAEKQLIRDELDRSDEEETAGEYTKASDTDLAKRKIISAKRRNPDSSGGPSPFSNFTGFGASSTSTSTSFLSNIQTVQPLTKESPIPKQTTSEKTVETEKSNDMESLKTLNLSCCSWIQQHLNENPYVVLLPVFKDYEKHLASLNILNPTNSTISKTVTTKLEAPKQATFEFKRVEKPESKFAVEAPSKTIEPAKPDIVKPANAVSSTTFPGFNFTGNGTGNSSEAKSKINFTFTANATPLNAEKSENKVASSVSSTTFPLFQFKSSTSNTPSSLTSKEPMKLSSAPLFVGPAPGFFSNKFGGNTTGFGSIAPPSNPPSEQQDGENADEPPETNFVPVAEEGTVFDIRCRVFLKKANEFSPIGVGTLYLKTVGENKTQLLVRADTAGGLVLLNFLLTKDIPIQPTGKNNLLLVCIPTPDAKPPPVPVLVRVKNGEERDKLMKEIEKLRGC